MSSNRKKEKEVLPPMLLSAEVEVCASFLTRGLQRDLRTLSPVFVPKLKESNKEEEHQVKVNTADLIVVVLFQRSFVDLADMGPAAQDEKDRLLAQFMSYFEVIRKRIEGEGFWCDAVDPCSGLLVDSPRGGGMFSDLDFISAILPCTCQQAGGCAVLVHPAWGSGVYPSLFFTTCPPSFLVPLLTNPQHFVPEEIK